MPSFKDMRRRGKEKIFQKVGQSEKEVDAEFDALVNDFEIKERAIKSFAARLQSYGDALKALQEAGKSLAEEAKQLVALQEDKGDNPALKQVIATTTRVGDVAAASKNHLSKLEHLWKTNLTGPLRDVRIYTFKLKQLVKDRKKDKIDFEAYRRKANKFKSNTSGEKAVEQAKVVEKLEGTQSRYRDTSAFLKLEFQRMNSSWHEIISEELITLLRSQATFFSGIGKDCNEALLDTVGKHDSTSPTQTRHGQTRKNKWLRNGSARVHLLVGYNDEGDRGEGVKRVVKSWTSTDSVQSTSSSHSTRDLFLDEVVPEPKDPELKLKYIQNTVVPFLKKELELSEEQQQCLTAFLSDTYAELELRSLVERHPDRLTEIVQANLEHNEEESKDTEPCKAETKPPSPVDATSFLDEESE